MGNTTSFHDRYETTTTIAASTVATDYVGWFVRFARRQAVAGGSIVDDDVCRVWTATAASAKCLQRVWPSVDQCFKRLRCVSSDTNATATAAKAEQRRVWRVL